MQMVSNEETPLAMPAQTHQYHLTGLKGLGIITGVGRVRDHSGPDYPHLHQTGDLRVIEAQCQLLPLCHQSLTSQRDCGMLSEINNNGRMGPM